MLSFDIVRHLVFEVDLFVFVVGFVAVLLVVNVQQIFGTVADFSVLVAAVEHDADIVGCLVGFVGEQHFVELVVELVADFVEADIAAAAVELVDCQIEGTATVAGVAVGFAGDAVTLVPVAIVFVATAVVLVDVALRFVVGFLFAVADAELAAEPIFAAGTIVGYADFDYLELDAFQDNGFCLPQAQFLLFVAPQSQTDYSQQLFGGFDVTGALGVAVDAAV